MSISFPIRSRSFVTKPRWPHGCETCWHRHHRFPTKIVPIKNRENYFASEAVECLHGAATTLTPATQRWYDKNEQATARTIIVIPATHRYRPTDECNSVGHQYTSHRMRRIMPATRQDKGRHCGYRRFKDLRCNRRYWWNFACSVQTRISQLHREPPSRTVGR